MPSEVYKTNGPELQAFNELYDQMYSQALQQYVGPGKRFPDEATFKKWIGGEGQGAAEFFGQGPTNDKDPFLQKLRQVGQVAKGYVTNTFEGIDEVSARLMSDPEYQKILGGIVKGNDPNAPVSNQDIIEAKRRRLIDQITKFANEMNMPVGELMQRDEFAQALNRQTYQNAMASGMSTGAGAGGLSQANASDSAARALLGYQGQRQAMGLQAYNQAMSGLQGLGNEAEDVRRYEQGINFQMQQAAAAAQQQAAAQKAAMLQAGLSIAGGAVGYGLGGAQGASFGSSLGGGVGSALGGMGYKPYQYTYPSAAGRGTGGQGLGGSTFKGGGNY